MRRQFRNVRRTRNGDPDVTPSSVTSIVNVSVRFGVGSPGSKMWAITSSRTSRSAPGITGCPGAARSRMKAGALVGSPAGFAQLRDGIKLTDRWLVVHAPEYRGNFDQDHAGGAAAEDGHVGRVPQFGGVDRFRSRSADVLLRDEIRGSQRHRRGPDRRLERACRRAPSSGSDRAAGLPHRSSTVRRRAPCCRERSTRNMDCLR